jgi:aminoglycoside phosphotransferase (APT) family kinase protein
MSLPHDVIAWVEQCCGGRVVDIEQQGRWRAHHFLTVQQAQGAISVLARSQRRAVAPNSFLAHFDIAHEARVLEALQGKGLKVPNFLGFNERHGIILMERVAGTNELSQAPDDDSRKKVMTEYIEQLALLHGIDVESMKLSGLEIPTTPEEAAFAGKFGFMEADYRRMQPKLGPEPLLDLGVWWLHANVPRGERRVSFVQADTGPGQFMFADGHLTALIDWELSHIGDPMLDLGVIRMRNMLYPTGPLKEPIAHYAHVSGHAIDWPALRFYTVMSMLLTPLGLSLSMQRPTARVEHMFPSFGWDATLRRGLCDALAEAIGVEIQPPELPEVTTTASGPPLMDYLVEQLELNCAPVASDDAGRYEISCAIAIARAAQLQSSIGAELLDADLRDMAAVLGRRPHDRADGLAKLNQLVADGPAERLEELVALFARIERRREHLTEPMMIAQDRGDFEPLAPLEVAR